jgi:hypothetical protein
MIITLAKFGTMLLSRESGREALLVLAPTLSALGADEPIVVDFEGVLVFTPSWGDEVLGKLLDDYGDRTNVLNTKNSSVRASLELIESIHARKFVRV